MGYEGDADELQAQLEDLSTMTLQDQERYWQTQTEASTVTAATLPYDEACKVLNYDPRYPSPFDVPPKQKAAIDRALARAAERYANGANPHSWDEAEEELEDDELKRTKVLILNIWQVLGVEWMERQEATPIEGGILTDDCGIGKTLQALVLVLRAARRLEQLHKDGQFDGPFQPTLILCPPHVIDIWFSECRTWTGKLEIYRWYESPEKVKDSIARQFTLPVKAWDLAEHIRVRWPSNNPRSAFKLVISPYDTCTIRGLKEKLESVSVAAARGKPADFSLTPPPLPWSFLPDFSLPASLALVSRARL